MEEEIDIADLAGQVSDELPPSEVPVQCEYLCGTAGTGKTTELKRRIEADPTYGILASTTGISACNLGTTTVNSLLGYFDTKSLRHSYEEGRLHAKLRKLAIDRTNRICIDEISMMCAEQLDLIHQAVYEVNQYKTVKHPIGLVACGDYCQLPPVEGEFAFQAQCWDSFAANTTRLTKIWRQSDARYLEALNFARAGMGKECLDILLTMTQLYKTRDEDFDGTTIVPVNVVADKHNFTTLLRLKGKRYQVKSRRWGKQVSEWRHIPEVLEMKQGALVMILSNDSPAFSYGNGDTGHIVDFDPSTGKFAVKLKRNGNTVLIGPIHRTTTAKEPPDHLSDVEDFPAASMGFKPFGKVSYDDVNAIYHIGGVEFYPLRVAYASTVHRVQGLSLDRIQFDFKHKFAGNEASMYVGLSRCKTPEGLRLVGDADTFIERVKVNADVVPWL